jgi:hypothetical protein
MAIGESVKNEKYFSWQRHTWGKQAVPQPLLGMNGIFWGQNVHRKETVRMSQQYHRCKYVKFCQKWQFARVKKNCKKI